MNREIVARSEEFFGYERPTDFRLEMRHPQLFPTNVRPETLAQDAELKRLAANGELEHAEFLRFTSPVRTRYPENDIVNARWYPAKNLSAENNKKQARQAGKPKQAIIVLPQWNADAFSHNALCTLFNRFGISALRLSLPYHYYRMPAELERADYAVSSNVARTIDATRQAVIDTRSCADWLEKEGYESIGIVGTSLGSCYAFLASTHDDRLKVNVFNHCSTHVADVVWEGLSTRHIRAGMETAVTVEQLREVWMAISPPNYIERYARLQKKPLFVYARYDTTFPTRFSEQVIQKARELRFEHEAVALPCGHYTLGEAPFKYIDGYHICRFLKKHL